MEQFYEFMKYLFSRTKKLAVFVGVGLTIASLILLLGGLLTPVALGIFGNIILALMIGTAAFLAARGIVGAVNLYMLLLKDGDDAKSAKRLRDLFLQPVCALAGFGVFATFIVLAATGIWAPVAMSIAGAVFASLGAGLCATLMFHEGITAVDNVFSIIIHNAMTFLQKWGPAFMKGLTLSSLLKSMFQITEKFLWYVTWLAIPTATAVLVVGLVLSFGGVLAPVAIGILGNIMLALMIGFATLGGTILGVEIFGWFKQTFGSYDDLTRKEEKEHNKIGAPEKDTNYLTALTCTVLGLAATATFITLAVTGLWLPVALSATATVFVAIGAALSSGFMFWDICDRLRSMCTMAVTLTEKWENSSQSNIYSSDMNKSLYDFTDNNLPQRVPANMTRGNVVDNKSPLDIEENPGNDVSNVPKKAPPSPNGTSNKLEEAPLSSSVSEAPKEIPSSNGTSEVSKPPPQKMANDSPLASTPRRRVKIDTINANRRVNNTLPPNNPQTSFKA